MILTRLLHHVIASVMKRDHQHFLAKLPQAGKIQETLLLNLIRKNQYSRFGKEHNFAGIISLSAYKRQVPIRDYEGFKPYIQTLGASDTQALTSEKTLIFEPTSGSNSASKFIPYTASLRQEFNRAIQVWLYDLYRHVPGIRHGQHYWSISPAGTITTPFPTTIPVGFADDAAYLGITGSLLKQLFVMPGVVKKINHMPDFYYTASYFLLQSRKLSLISVWNPSYLLLLLQYCLEHAPDLFQDLASGQLSHTTTTTARLLKPYLHSDRKRARELELAYNAYQQHGKQDRLFTAWWPALALVSAWADGASAADYNSLKSLLPQAQFQAKGLLATEGIVCFPLWQAPNPLPAYNSHFFEFIPSSTGAQAKDFPAPTETLGLDELKAGESYQVILTTGGGLYRYALGDIVFVTGFFQGLPMLRFIARATVCDLVGEKLSEDFVAGVLAEAFSELCLQPAFAMLAPEVNKLTKYYILFIEAARLDRKLASSLRMWIEKKLCYNFYYKQARNLGQLAELQIVQIPADGYKAYMQRLTSEGMVLGNIKMVSLDKRPDWRKFLKGVCMTDAHHIN